jgi:hypothetical protein
MAVFSVVAPRSLVAAYRRFRGPCYLHDQGDYIVGGNEHLWNVRKLLPD